MYANDAAYKDGAQGANRIALHRSGGCHCSVI